MKKFLTFTLCIAMVSTLLTGCGNGNAEVVESNTVTEEVQTVEPEVEVEPTEEVKEDSDAEKDTPEEKAEEKTFADTGLTEEYALEKFSRAVDAYKNATGVNGICNPTYNGAATTTEGLRALIIGE